MSFTSSSSFSASFATSDGDVAVLDTHEAIVSVEQPDESDVEGTVVSVMGDAVGIGEDTFAYASGFSVVAGDSFYATVDLLAVATSDTDIAYASTGAVMTYSSSSDVVFSIQTTRTRTVSDGDGSLSASATSGDVTGICWSDDFTEPPGETDAPEIDDVLGDAEGCGDLIDGNIAFAIGDATAFGDDAFTDLSLSVLTLDDTISSASVSILIIA